eukprot:NODE_727_length_4406_cov_0.729046.p2 type:complete len:268 gc:universal NODE_727_length_4406_cov_0.729046:2362-3165(+)
MILNLIGDNQRHDNLHSFFSFEEKGSNMKLILLTIVFGMMTLSSMTSIGQLQKQILGKLQTCPSTEVLNSLAELKYALQSPNSNTCSLLSNHPLASQFLETKSRQLMPLLEELHGLGGNIDDLVPAEWLQLKTTFEEQLDENGLTTRDLLDASPNCNSRLKKRAFSNKFWGVISGVLGVSLLGVGSFCAYLVFQDGKRPQCNSYHTTDCHTDKESDIDIEAIGSAVVLLVGLAFGLFSWCLLGDDDSASASSERPHRWGASNSADIA